MEETAHLNLAKREEAGHDSLLDLVIAISMAAR